MLNLKHIGVAVTVILAYVLAIFVPFIWIGVIASLPLLRVRKRYALIGGFVIGFLAPLSMYLLYPVPMIGRLAEVISQIASIPSFLAILGYPLFYGLMMGLGGLFWAGLAENIRMNKHTPIAT